MGLTPEQQTQVDNDLLIIRDSALAVAAAAKANDQRIIDYVDQVDAKHTAGIKVVDAKATETNSLLVQLIEKIDINGNLEIDDVRNLFDQATNNGEQIKSLVTQLAGLASQVQTNSTQISDNKQAIADLEKRVKANEDWIAQFIDGVRTDAEIESIADDVAGRKQVETVRAIAGALEGLAFDMELKGNYAFNGGIANVTGIAARATVNESPNDAVKVNPLADA